MYSRFARKTEKDEKAKETNKMDIHSELSKQWNSKVIKTDWLKLEDVLVNILGMDDTAEEKVALCKEAIDAFTRRGHFVDFPTQREEPKGAVSNAPAFSSDWAELEARR